VINYLNMNAATRVGLNSLLLLGAVVALYLGQTIIIPTIIALLLAAMLWPATVWLHQRLRFPWGIACLAVVSGLVLLNLLVTMAFALAIPKMLQVLPRTPPTTRAGTEIDQRQQIYTALRDKLIKLFPLDEDLFPVEAEQSQPYMYVADTVTKFVPDALLRLGYLGLGYLWQWILILFILFFMLLEGRMLLRRVVAIFGPSQEVQTKARQVLSDMARQVRAYLVWRTIINIGVAIVVGFIYRWANVSQAWTWAILTAILFYIPYFGPIIAGIPPILDAFVSNESPMLALGIFLIYLVVTILEGYLIFPVVMGRSMEMNATTVMVACLFWDLVWGIVGLFLAMPLMAAIKAICYHVPGWRPWANLMSITELEPEAEPVNLEPSRPELVLDNGEPSGATGKVRSTDVPSAR
jgi:predicted PurR-regulated permease PerM